MSALGYPVGFGFKGQDGYYYGPNGIVGLYHLGDDYYTPMNTPLTLQEVSIGLTGKSGTAGGPHLHVAKWKQGNIAGGYYVKKYDRTYFEPSDVKTISGTVLNTGLAADPGKFVLIKADNGFTYDFFHLNEIYVKQGDVIGANMDIIETLQSALNLARKNEELYESALNASKKTNEILESALNASRAENEELKKALDKDAQVLSAGKYTVK